MEFIKSSIENNLQLSVWKVIYCFGKPNSVLPVVMGHFILRDFSRMLVFILFFQSILFDLFWLRILKLVVVNCFEYNMLYQEV